MHTQNRLSNLWSKRVLAAGIVAVAVSASTGQAVNVILDFPGGATNFFYNNPTAQAAVQKAASDLSSALTTNLSATTDTVTANVSPSTVTYNFDLNYTDPNSVSNANVTLGNAAIPANEFRVFVGQRNLTGGTLGQGGPGGVGLAASGSGSNPTFPTAVSNANALGTANFGRGGGPNYGTITGSLGGNPISVTTGPTNGNLWFDVDTDDVGGIDSASTLSSFWHYDANAPVAAGKIDLYSVALHEIIHALGIGTSVSWTSNVSGGTNWIGTNVITLLGSGANTVAGDGSHVAIGLNSPTLIGNILQETVMSPSIGFGQRKILTLLDRAFLQDINWTVAIPEPTTISVLLMAGAMALRRVRRA